MIGVVIVTHDGLAEALAKSLFHVLGPEHPCFECIGVDRDDAVELVRERVEGAVRRVDQGAGVLILTDLFGGTPSNVAMSLVEAGRVDVLSGVNLPMLVRIMSARQASLGDTIERAIQGGREGILLASEMIDYWRNCGDKRVDTQQAGTGNGAP
ncbi:PTS sugar transporter subunit IIA [Thermithiobacillus plumbiphilus]|uniref:PTS sugar transporter subunit IIA n=1 Tax=Thermithiobacillus plumbiphilus TaxID=1729899 RepID=A0ABU9DB53_9PROT